MSPGLLVSTARVGPGQGVEGLRDAGVEPRRVEEPLPVAVDVDREDLVDGEARGRRGAGCARPAAARPRRRSESTALEGERRRARRHPLERGVDGGRDVARGVDERAVEVEDERAGPRPTPAPRSRGPSAARASRRRAPGSSGPGAARARPGPRAASAARRGEEVDAAVGSVSDSMSGSRKGNVRGAEGALADRHVRAAAAAARRACPRAGHGRPDRAHGEADLARRARRAARAAGRASVRCRPAPVRSCGPRPVASTPSIQPRVSQLQVVAARARDLDARSGTGSAPCRPRPAPCSSRTRSGCRVGDVRLLPRVAAAGRSSSSSSSGLKRRMYLSPSVRTPWATKPRWLISASGGRAARPPLERALQRPAHRGRAASGSPIASSTVGTTSTPCTCSADARARPAAAGELHDAAGRGSARRRGCGRGASGRGRGTPRRGRPGTRRGRPS